MVCSMITAEWWPGPGYLVAIAMLSAVLLGIGLWSIVPTGQSRGGLFRREKATIVSRVAHSLRDLSAVARAELRPTETNPIAIAGVVLSPVWERVAAIFDRVLGGANEELLSRAGVNFDAREYSLRRVLAVVCGGAVGLLIGGLLALVRSEAASAAPLVVAAVGGVSGLWLLDRSLRLRAKARQERLTEEFPTVLELLALALSAGESLPGAIRRISERGTGELAREWARVLRVVELGEPLGQTLVASARALGVAELEALCDHLASALERGAPLAEVVRAHSSDSRLSQLRRIVDRAGKAEVAMLVPLVLLILPVTVVFAVWPSLQALQLGF